jgi:hypothetical protein
LWLALVTDAVTIGVDLVGVHRAWAVVAGIADAVPISVLLLRIGDCRTPVAWVANRVGVSVLLAGIGDMQAVVCLISDAVTVRVDGRRGWAGRGTSSSLVTRASGVHALHIDAVAE